jgi:putative thioredoxin
MAVPVVIDLWADWCGPCKQLTPVLETLADEYAGRFLLTKVDVDAEQQIAAAFQVQSIPSVFAVIGGQPVPLFQGALPAAQVRQYLDELLRVAGENGISGTVAPEVPAAGDTGPEGPDEPSPVEAEFDRAVAAIDVGDWEAARAAYRAVLTIAPGDVDAVAGLAQVDLWQRTEGVDAATALAAAHADPADVDASIVAADVLAASGDRAQAYARLVTAVRLSAGDERTRARTRLLELFELAPADDPEVAAARRALAAALY